MITSCPRCGGQGCAYCSNIGQIDYADYDVGYDRSLRQAFQEVHKLESMLQELLAVIHGDGGHYTAGHGLEKSCNDARTKVAGTMYRLDQVTVNGKLHFSIKLSDDEIRDIAKRFHP